MEVAEERKLSHVLCDPNTSERNSLGISSEGTQNDNERREQEWLRRLGIGVNSPVLFICGANHAQSFAGLCSQNGLQAIVVTGNFEDSSIPLDRRFI